MNNDIERIDWWTKEKPKTQAQELARIKHELNLCWLKIHLKRNGKRRTV